jgi:hypothetical protein
MPATRRILRAQRGASRSTVSCSYSLIKCALAPRGQARVGTQRRCGVTRGDNALFPMVGKCSATIWMGKRVLTLIVAPQAKPRPVEHVVSHLAFDGSGAAAGCVAAARLSSPRQVPARARCSLIVPASPEWSRTGGTRPETRAGANAVPFFTLRRS